MCLFCRQTLSNPCKGPGGIKWELKFALYLPFFDWKKGYGTLRLEIRNKKTWDGDWDFDTKSRLGNGVWVNLWLEKGVLLLPMQYPLLSTLIAKERQTHTQFRVIFSLLFQEQLLKMYIPGINCDFFHRHPNTYKKKTNKQIRNF